MKLKKQFLLLLPLAVILLAGASCISFSSKQAAGPDVGLFKTIDKGKTWKQKVSLMGSNGALASFPGASIISFEKDPSDTSAFYLGTSESGLFYTYNKGENWFQPSKLTNNNISSIVVDPTNKCTIYIANLSIIAKSVDCNRNYDRIYQDTRANVTINSLEIDFFNPAILYAGNSKGDLLKSVDSGANWQVVYRFSGAVVKVMVDPFDSRILYVALDGRGIFKSVDSGVEWEDLSPNYKEFKDSLQFRDFVFDPNNKNNIFLACKYGLLKSADAGATWQEIPLLTPPSSTDIFSMAINPKNSNELFYVTSNTLYSSLDAGKSWKTSKLPSGSQANKLFIDQDDPNIMYLGYKAIKK